MSFLYKEEVYGNIIDKSHIVREAQNTTPINNTLVAKKLVNNLSRELTNAPVPLNIVSTNPVGLNVNDLQNLGKLLQFLSNNQIKLDGNRVAYTEADNNALPEAEQLKLSPITVNMSRDAATRKWNTADYYANLPSLISYVKYLQRKAQSLKESGNAEGRVLEVMIGKLIDQINSIKPDSGLSRKPKSTPDKPNELPADEELDGFGSKIFDIKNPYADQGPIQLRSRDLANKEALNNWMQTTPEAQVVMYDDKGKKTQLLYSNPKSNICLVINILYLRAQRRLQLSKSVEDTRKYTFYVNRIREIGPSFTDPDGKACSITANISNLVSGNKSNTDQGEDTENNENSGNENGNNNSGLRSNKGKGDGTGGNGYGGSGSGAITDLELEQLVQALPLDAQDIDFHRILTFFNLYKNFVSGRYRTEVFASMRDAGVAMQRATAVTANGYQKNFRLTRNVQEFAAYLKAPQGENANACIQFLHQVISETGKVILAFYNEYARAPYSKDRNRTTFDPEQQALVEGQVKGSSSLYYQNLRDLQTLMANVQSWMSRRK